MQSFSQQLMTPPELQVTPIESALTRRAGVQLSLLRLDLVDDGVSGNKWYKLLCNLRHAQQQQARCIVSFGGAWSNHIHALACAGHRLGIPTVGVIRGEPGEQLTPTLTDAERWGMELHFVSRQAYRQRHDPLWQQALLARWPGAWLVPEGGSNPLALAGMAELVAQIQRQDIEADALVTACGTGGTLAGLVAAAPPQWRVLGVAALKGAGFLYDDVQQLLQQAGVEAAVPWCIDLDGHQRGYGRTTPDLLAFMQRFEGQHAVPLEHVYTAKMLFRLEQLIENSVFLPGTRILALHTGGLQGRRGLTG